MCKICWKLRIKKTEQSQCYHSCVLTLSFTWCYSVFSVPIADFELVKSRYIVRATVPKCDDISLLLFARNIDLLQSETNSEPHLKYRFFAKIVYSLQSLTILTRSSIFRSVTWCWICLAYFFRFTFIIDLFSSLNIFKY